MRLEVGAGLPECGFPAIYWLGQAGFWIDMGSVRVLIDPYLSDSLARKYAGKAHPHIRMAPAPVSVADLPRPDLVLITHAHTDHMDPDTLGPLAKRFPDLPFVVPAAVLNVARQRIRADANLIPVDVGHVLAPLPDLRLTVFPAAHEDRSLDEEGRHHFLGYGITSSGVKLYHSGDSIPFDDLDAAVQAFAPDIALLPVNGRDAARKAAGIPGNFTLSEAYHLARNCRFFVPHHFGMFDFNTLYPQQIDALIVQQSDGPTIVRPVLGGHLRIVT